MQYSDRLLCYSGTVCWLMWQYSDRLLCYSGTVCWIMWCAVHQVSDGVPQGLILGPLFFLLYINDLPNAILDLSTPVLFRDDTSLIIWIPDSLQFEKDINTVIQTLQKWFHNNLLFLNFEKTQILQFFFTKNINAIKLHLT